LFLLAERQVLLQNLDAKTENKIFPVGMKEKYTPMET
jgi:hypothetical protein